MKTSSAKQKGRLGQQLVRDKLLAVSGLSPDDVISRSMGSSGEDLILSPRARDIFPISVEVKVQEKVNVWSSWSQTLSNSKTHQPVLVIKKNRTGPLAVVSLDYLIELMFENWEYKQGITLP